MSTLRDTAISFALLAAVFWPLERLFPARPGQPWVRARWFTDLAFFSGQYLLWGGLVVFALDATHSALTSLVPARIPELISMQPRALQVIEVLFFADLGVYWFHRACHHFDFLWRFHAVHHSSEHLDWLAAHREHPLDGLCTQLVVNLPAFIMGFDLHTLGWAIALRGMWGLYIHSNARLPIGPLKYLLGAPELHHWHHARVDRTAHNFANLAPWCDLLFGTYHCPEGAETYELGLTEPWPKSYLGQLAKPLLPHSSPEPSPSCSPSFTESNVSH
ncbi:MAG: sterol desaturase family protein [Myxococcaceae bacterium]